MYVENKRLVWLRMNSYAHWAAARDMAQVLMQVFFQTA